MYQQIISQSKEAFEKALAHLEQEYAGIHAGRATTALVENIAIDTYGSSQPIKSLAQITVTEATQLTIQPWDQSLVETIENTIRDKNLGFGLQNDGRIIRVNTPPLNEERRREMTKMISKIAEKARIAIRNGREDARKDLKKFKGEGTLSEDGLKTAFEDLQKNVDEINNKIEEKEKSKEKEVMTV